MTKLFKKPWKKEKCSKCGREYDAALSTCPHCGAISGNADFYRPFAEMTSMGFSTELILFLMGLLGFQLFGYILSQATKSFVVMILSYAGLSGASLAAGANAFFASGDCLAIINDGSYLILLIVFLILIGKDLRRLFARFKSWRTFLGFPIGVGLIIVSVLITELITAIVNAAGGQITTNENQTAINEMIASWPWLSLLFLGVIGPFCEEIAYRVGLFGATRRVNVYLAYFVASIIFGLIHLHSFTSVNEWLSFADYAVAGFILALTYEKYGFGASFIAHAVNNIFSVLMEILLLKAK